MNARQKFSAPSILRQLREVSQQVPTWLVGMAHIAQREHEVLVNSAAGTVGDESESDSGGEEEFGGQDFRKTAKKGTWGSQKDLNFADFDEKAYAGSATTTPSVEWDSSPEETSIVDAESHDSDVGRDSDKGTTTANGTASDQEPERGVDYERQQIKLAVERYKRPTPSRDLLQALDAARLQVGNRPEQRIEKMLQAKNRKLYFEYIGMFPVELIETYQSRFKGSTVGMKKVSRTSNLMHHPRDSILQTDGVSGVRPKEKTIPNRLEITVERSSWLQRNRAWQKRSQTSSQGIAVENGEVLAETFPSLSLRRSFRRRKKKFSSE